MLEPRGYSNNLLTGNKGVSILESFLYSDTKKRFQCHFPKSDTYPNYDGSFQVLRKSNDKKSMYPYITVETQIKSTEDNIKNNNKKKHISDYKYCCDTAIFNSFKNRVSNNPTVLFIVELNRNKVFYIVLTNEYVKQLQIKEKQRDITLYFNNDDELTNFDIFISKIESIQNSINKAFDEYEKHNILGELNMPKDRKKSLFEAMDYANYKLSSSLSYLKKWSFDDIWKVGFLYNEDNGRYWLALRLLKYDEDQSINVKSFNYDITRNTSMIPLGPFVNDGSHFAKSAKIDYPYKNAVDDLIDIWNKAFLETWFIPPDIMTDDMLNELCFFFLDWFVNKFKLYQSKINNRFFNKNKISSYDFFRFVQSIYYAEESLIIDLYNEMNLKFDDACWICNGESFKSQSSKQNFIKYISEYLDNDAKYSNKIKLRIHYSDMPLNYISKISQEIMKRNLNPVRLWKFSSSKEIENRFTNKQTQIYYPMFDSSCTKNMYVNNFKKYVTCIGDARHDVITNFFENKYEPDSINTKYKLFIDDNQCHYMYKNFKSNNNSCSIKVVYNNLEFDENMNNWSDEKNFISGCMSSAIPDFTKLPLYNKVLWLILKVLKKEDNSIRIPISDDVAKRSEDITTYTLSSKL